MQRSYFIIKKTKMLKEDLVTSIHSLLIIVSKAIPKNKVYSCLTAQQQLKRSVVFREQHKTESIKLYTSVLTMFLAQLR